MPFDANMAGTEKTVTLREAVLDLMASQHGEGPLGDREYRQELRRLVAAARRPVDDLFDKYHTPCPDFRARTWTRYAF